MSLFLFILLNSVFISLNHGCAGTPKETRANAIIGTANNGYGSIKPLSTGNYVMTYFTNSPATIKGSVFNATGFNISSEFSIAGGNRPSIAPLSSSFAVCYSSSNTPRFTLFSNIGLQIGLEVQVSSLLGDIYVECGTLSGETSFVICFTNNADSNIYCSTYSEAGNELSAPKIHSNQTVQANLRIHMITLKFGGYVLAYTKNQNYYGCIFNSNAIQVVNEFKMNNLPESSEAFAMAALSNGAFAFSYVATNNMFSIFWPNGTRMANEMLIGSSAGYTMSIAANYSGGVIVTYTTSSSSVIYNIFSNYGRILGTLSAKSSSSLNDNSLATFLPSGNLVIGVTIGSDTFMENILLTSCTVIHLITLIPLEILEDQKGMEQEQEGLVFVINLFSQRSNYSMPKVLSAVSYTAVAAVGTTVSSSFISGASPTLLWGLMSFLQQFFYLLFLNVDIPDNLKKFLSLFSFANLDFLPNLLQLIKLPDYDSPKNFYENQFTGLFLKTVASNIEVWIIVSTFVIILTFMRKQTYLTVKIRLIMFKSCPIRMWVDSLPLFLIAICLQFNHFNFDEPVGIISLILSLILFVVIVLTPLYFWWAIKTNKSNSLIHHPLFEDFDANHPQKKYYPVYELLKKMMAALTIVYAYDYPIHQVLGLAIINTMYFGCLLAIKPRRTKRENYFYLLLEFLSVLIHISLSFFHYSMDDTKKESIGYIIIGMIIACVGLSVVPMLTEQIRDLNKLCKKRTNSGPKNVKLPKITLTRENGPTYKVQFTEMKIDSELKTEGDSNPPLLENSKYMKNEKIETVDRVIDWIKNPVVIGGSLEQPMPLIVSDKNYKDTPLNSMDSKLKLEGTTDKSLMLNKIKETYTQALEFSRVKKSRTITSLGFGGI